MSRSKARKSVDAEIINHYVERAIHALDQLEYVCGMEGSPLHSVTYRTKRGGGRCVKIRYKR